MPSIIKDGLGVWGEPTSSIDWCETNYEVTVYVAEFWNTLSNLAMIIPSLYGLYSARKYSLELRYYVSFSMLLLVGIGSTLFHMTLQYSMQLMDELPMIYGSCVFIYSMGNVKTGSRDKPAWLTVVLFLYAFLFTAIYSVWNNPLVHEFLNAFLIAVLFVQAFMLLKNNYNTTCAKLYIIGTILYGLAFLLWNIDNHFCSNLQKIRESNPLAVGAATQLHAWWHIFAGYATYLHILFSIHFRLSHQQRKPEFRACIVGVEVAKGIPP